MNYPYDLKFDFMHECSTKAIIHACSGLFAEYNNCFKLYQTPKNKTELSNAIGVYNKEFFRRNNRKICFAPCNYTTFKMTIKNNEDHILHFKIYNEVMKILDIEQQKYYLNI